MVSTRENRQKFIHSAIALVRKYGFDGLDFDWDPGDQKRGGHAEDAENFVLFLKEMREATNAENLEQGQERLIFSIALPVDWLNIMAYNLHGQWESQVFCAAPLNDPASETKYSGYSLVQAIQSMAPSTVNPQQFNLGLALSGVTFTLKDKSKTFPESPANGPRESSSTTDAFHHAPILDEKSQCMYMVLDQDQWVGFDTPETFSYKVESFRKYGFGA
ncbi:hypothetical protein BGW39_004913, partial [Mortierella sp. 14UC]